MWSCPARGRVALWLAALLRGRLKVCCWVTLCEVMRVKSEAEQWAQRLSRRRPAFKRLCASITRQAQPWSRGTADGATACHAGTSANVRHGWMGQGTCSSPTRCLPALQSHNTQPTRALKAEVLPAYLRASPGDVSLLHVYLFRASSHMTNTRVYHARRVITRERVDVEDACVKLPVSTRSSLWKKTYSGDCQLEYSTCTQNP
jgi:hypothetical protein